MAITHRMTGTPEYHTWANMKKRCLVSTNKDYPRYGGRGIRICDRWLSFENFYADMGNKPFPKAQLDRIDNDGNYEPGNCRWVTSTENNRDRSNSTITPELAAHIKWLIAQEMSSGDVAKALNVSYYSEYDIRRGKSWKEIKPLEPRFLGS